MNASLAATVLYPTQLRTSAQLLLCFLRIKILRHYLPGISRRKQRKKAAGLTADRCAVTRGLLLKRSFCRCILRPTLTPRPRRARVTIQWSEDKITNPRRSKADLSSLSSWNLPRNQSKTQIKTSINPIKHILRRGKWVATLSTQAIFLRRAIAILKANRRINIFWSRLTKLLLTP